MTAATRPTTSGERGAGVSAQRRYIGHVMACQVGDPRRCLACWATERAAHVESVARHGYAPDEREWDGWTQ